MSPVPVTLDSPAEYLDRARTAYARAEEGRLSLVFARDVAVNAYDAGDDDRLHLALVWALHYIEYMARMHMAATYNIMLWAEYFAPTAGHLLPWLQEANEPVPVV